MSLLLLGKFDQFIPYFEKSWTMAQKHIYLYISLGIFILNGKLSTRKVESSSDSPPYAQKQIDYLHFGTAAA